MLLSLGVLRSYPRLLAYPLAAAAGGLLAGALSLGVATALLGGGAHARAVIVLAVAIAAYPVALTWTFCAVGMAAVLAARFDGEGASAVYGWRFARERIRAIAGWALLDCAGGLALRPVRGLVPAARRTVIAALGAPWGPATRLAVPVLAYEEPGPRRALRRSAQLLGGHRKRRDPGTAGLGPGAVAPFALLVLVGIALGGSTGIALAAAGGVGILVPGGLLAVTGKVFALLVYRSAAGLAEDGDSPFARRDLEGPRPPAHGRLGRVRSPSAARRPARPRERPAATAGRRRR
jgi:hypothetical protein